MYVRIYINIHAPKSGVGLRVERAHGGQRAHGGRHAVRVGPMRIRMDGSSVILKRVYTFVYTYVVPDRLQHMNQVGRQRGALLPPDAGYGEVAEPLDRVM